MLPSEASTASGVVSYGLPSSSHPALPQELKSFLFISPVLDGAPNQEEHIGVVTHHLLIRREP